MRGHPLAACNVAVCNTKSSKNGWWGLLPTFNNSFIVHFSSGQVDRGSAVALPQSFPKSSELRQFPYIMVRRNPDISLNFWNFQPSYKNLVRQSTSTTRLPWEQKKLTTKFFVPNKNTTSRLGEQAPKRCPKNWEKGQWGWGRAGGIGAENL